MNEFDREYLQENRKHLYDEDELSFMPFGPFKHSEISDCPSNYLESVVKQPYLRPNLYNPIMRELRRRIESRKIADSPVKDELP